VIYLLKIYIYFIYFFIYSILGWMTEMIYCRICQGKWINRGFFYGPYCPIYGFGGLLIILLLSPFSSFPLFLFILSALVITLVEYSTSYIMEKMFAAKWWDYSHLPFNLNGRICLLNTFEFTILALVIVYVVQPYVESFVKMLPYEIVFSTFYISLLVLIIDFIFSLNNVLNFKAKLEYIQSLTDQIKQKQAEKLQNSDVTAQLEKIKNDFITKTSTLKNRIISAFPTIEFKKFESTFEELKEIMKKYDKIETKIKNKKEKRKS